MTFWRENSKIYNLKINLARFARNVKWDILSDFQTLWIRVPIDVLIKDDERLSKGILSKRTKGLPVHVLLSSLSSWQSPHACRCRDNGSPETPFPILWVGRRWMSFGYASVSVSPWELHHGGRDRLCRVNQLKNLEKNSKFWRENCYALICTHFGLKIVTF